MSNHLRAILATILVAFLCLHYMLSLYYFTPNVHAESNKKLILIGGGLDLDNEEIYKRIVELAGGEGKARIGVITAASPAPSEARRGKDDAEERGESYAERFERLYNVADAQWIPIDLDRTQNNSSPTVVQQINSMTGFFISGGDQTRLNDSFYLANRQPSPALEALKKRYEEGAVISGSSAGAAIQAEKAMFISGESYEALRDGVFTPSTAKKARNFIYDPNGGFKLFPYGLIDSHFSERGRQGRLLRLAWETGIKQGYGIDENTALVITNTDTPQAMMEVVGEHGVTMMDLTQAQSNTQPYWSINNVRMNYLTSGDIYQPSKQIITTPSWKKPLQIQKTISQQRQLSDDVFSSRENGDRENPKEFIETAIDLFRRDSLRRVTGISYEDSPTFEVSMDKTTATAYQGRNDGDSYLSFKNLQIAIRGY